MTGDAKTLSAALMARLSTADAARTTAPAAEPRAATDAAQAPQPASDAAFGRRIGRVVSIAGATAVVLLETAPAESGEAAIGIQIGALVKIPSARSMVYGMISGLTIPMPTQRPTEEEIKILEVELVGESKSGPDRRLSRIHRGISVSPELGSAVYLAMPQDLRFLYVRDGVAIGRIHQDRTLPAQVSVDDLLGKHFAIVGVTGSGKSCALTLILKAVLDRFPNGHVLLLDPHNEYARAFGALANVVGLGSLQLPYWMFNLQELREVLINTGSKIGPSEAALLNTFIIAAKRQFLGAAAGVRHVTSDTPTPYRMTQVIDYIDEVMGRLEKPDSLLPYEELKNAIAVLQNDSRFAFMFERSVTTRDNMSAILSRLFRIPVAGKPVTILDLSSVPSEILNVVVSVLCRTAFEFAMWSEGKVPMLLVCEEAHLYAPENTAAGFEPTKRALSRIVKEGRKYGLSLCIASQRPADLAASMLSQCNTIFAMRLTHQKDQDGVRAALSDGALVLLEALPSLGNAEAIAIGEGISLPMRLVFDELPPEQRPRSASAAFSQAWSADVADGEAFVQQVIERWRRDRH